MVDLDQRENFEVPPDENQGTDLNESEDLYSEETAAEYTPNPGMLGGRGPMEVTSDKTREDEHELSENDELSAGKAMGAVGIGLSIVSLFFLPLILAVAGIIFGAVAVRREQRALGYTAIGIGAFSLIMSLFFAPFVLV